MFYTYMYLRYDGTPYYIGKGNRYRAFDSFNHRLNCPPKDRILIQHYPTEAEAFEAEMFLISYYGRIDLGMGCLRNLTDGGEGCSGLICSDATRAKISKTKKDKPVNRVYKPHSEETKRKISETKKGTPAWNKGVSLSDEHCRNLSISHMGQQFSEETRQKLRAAQQARRMREAIENASL
jgi:hypothetical protein